MYPSNNLFFPHQWEQKIIKTRMPLRTISPILMRISPGSIYKRTNLTEERQGPLKTRKRTFFPRSTNEFQASNLHCGCCKESLYLFSNKIQFKSMTIKSFFPLSNKKFCCNFNTHYLNVFT